MDWFYSLLTDTSSIAHTALIYTAIITLGLALGRIKVKGISLGVIGVFLTITFPSRLLSTQLYLTNIGSLRAYFTPPQPNSLTDS